MTTVRLAALAALLTCVAWAVTAHAQQVWRIVGPDGRVTFTDRPPPDAGATPAQALPLTNTAANPLGLLPAELRNAVSRFPVVLYTGVDCVPCVSARGYLGTRGVPFTEKTVTSEEDIAALTRLSGVPRLPFATIGSQHVRGFSEPEWSQYLDAAGYPRTSQLPPAFRNPAPSPLVAVDTQQRTPAAPEPQPQAGAPAQPAEPPPNNPAGIRF